MTAITAAPTEAPTDAPTEAAVDAPIETTAEPAAPSAPQNLFGICARIGEDFGFNPLWLRLGFAAALILNPVAVIASYFALGAVVLASRLLFPNRKPAVATSLTLVVARPDPAAARVADLPLAA